MDLNLKLFAVPYFKILVGFHSNKSGIFKFGIFSIWDRALQGKYNKNTWEIGKNGRKNGN